MTDYIIESGPSTPARILTQITRSTVRPALRLGCRAAHLPWPFGAIEFAARVLHKPALPRETVQLSSCTATLFNAKRDTGRVMLYLHGGGFLACGPNTHAAMIELLSMYADCPVLAVDYRMLPKHSVGEAVSDCEEAYTYLRRSYDPCQIAIAGDSAGGYLAVTVANHMSGIFPEDVPGALCLISPFLEFDPEPKKRHPNIKCDAMFGPEAFDVLLKLAERANRGDGIYEPLQDLTPPLPPTLIHVSGHEVLLHDTRRVADILSDMGVYVEVHTWPGQIHVFQAAADFLPEAKRSLKQIGDFIRLRVGDQKTAAAKT